MHPALVAAYLSDSLRDLRRLRHRVTRGRRRTLTYSHQVDDPYSLLLAQVLGRWVEAMDAGLEILVLPATPSAFSPDPERLQPWALRDAAGLARQHGLRFPSAPQIPSAAAVAQAQVDALAAAAEGQLDVLAQISHALLGGELGGELGGVAQLPRAAAAQLQANLGWVLGHGHYQGGMVHYEGEWYWGLDRLVFLDERLHEEGLDLGPLLDPGARPIVEDGAIWGAKLEPGAVVELFYSVRSPYSYLALERSVALAARHDVELRVRPVLPMVMRGLAVPRAKRLYIARDAKRIADRAGIPFGRIADPLGAGVERSFGVAVLAKAQGLLLPWLSALGRAVWAEGIDVARDAGLRSVAASVGLDPREALSHARDDRSWRPELEANRAALLDMGLWGVPCFRFGELRLWGQDRLDVLDAALAGAGGSAGSTP